LPDFCITGDGESLLERLLNLVSRGIFSETSPRDDALDSVGTPVGAMQSLLGRSALEITREI
jgi:hypothetical protein